jgi:predicted nucleic acid-binding Zn ribbon protein
MEQLGDILRLTLKEFGIEKPIKQYEVLWVWPQVVGEKIASVTEPRNIVNGKLFIKVKNAAWRNELVFLKKVLIEKLNQKTGSHLVKDIIMI